MADANQPTRTVRGIVFTDKNTEGDFAWMEKQEKYKHTLFIYNDNFLDSQDDIPHEGAGTAKLRPLGRRFLQIPRAAGIPTGWSVASGGFKQKDFYSRKAIDASLDMIKIILRNNPMYTDIVFSCDANNNKKLGCNIFRPHDDCLNYISAELFKLESFDANNIDKEEDDVNKLERVLTPHAWLHYDLARSMNENAVLKKSLGLSVGSKRMR